MKFHTYIIVVSLAWRINCQNSDQVQFPDTPRNLQSQVNTLSANNPNLSSSYRQQSQAQLVNDSYLQGLREQVQQQNGNQGFNLNQNFNQNPYLYQYNNQFQNMNRNKILNNKPTGTQNVNENQQNLNTFGNQNDQIVFNQPTPVQTLLPPKFNGQEYYTTKVHNEESAPLPLKGANSAPLTHSNMTDATEAIKTASTVISNMGLFMMRNIDAEQKNVVMSPYSVVSMLALLQKGSLGETQRQISSVLQMRPDDVAAAFKLFTVDLQKRGTQRSVLRTASHIFIADDFQLNKDFKNFAIQNFGSDLSRVSFANSNIAANKINSWIAGKTNNMIDNMVSPDSVGQNTQMVLANAIYFKGLWKTMFKSERTMNKKFHLSNGVEKTVPFMITHLGIKCGYDQEAKTLIAILPFENDQYSLVLMLPSADSTVNDVLMYLTGTKMAGYQQFRKQDVHIELPKFNVKGDTNLQQLFLKMGINKIFSAGSDLSNIGLYQTASPQVSSALHTAMMSVDEKGATAAAATVVAVVALSYDNPSVLFQADRPFLAVLWDSQLNLPLFMTRIEDPSL